MIDLKRYSMIVSDSRQVQPGALYVACRGTAADGHRYIESAVAAGATGVVCEVLPPEETRKPEVSYYQVADSRRTLRELLRSFYRHPEADLSLFGVTGTNGKTTTAYLVQDFLARTGCACGLISTVEFRTPAGRMAATHTTPDAEAFFRLLGENRDGGARAVSMELSSHALDQHRVDGVKFRAAVFTNLTGDHLDYHHTVEHYFAAKKRLFLELLAPDGTAIVNVDDEYGRSLAAELRGRGVRVETFGRAADAECRIVAVKLGEGESRCQLVRGGRTYEIATTLVGEYNLHNLTGAMLGAEAMGASWEALVSMAATPCAVPGRLERMMTPKGVTFLVDYAHTDDALRQVLGALRKLARKRLIVVMGCGGDRDRTKRPRMGLAAGELADEVIVTSDNPRSEEPMAIIREIVGGIPAGVKYQVEPDRRAAIEKAYACAEPGDMVLVAGKGHEDYQEIQGKRHHFSDREVVAELGIKCMG